MEGNGKVSVLMGIYNCAETLPEAIDSILAQTYTDWELLLCDDASTDDTYAVAAAYRERYPDRIQLLRNDEHRFLAYSLNRCLAIATGEFVARMDGDDVSVPTRFETQVRFLREHPDVVLVGTAMRRFDDDGSEGAVDRRPERPNRQTLYHTTVFNHATVMAYKAVYDTLGGYTVCARTERGQDMDLWARFLKHGFQGANLQEVLYRVRENEAAFRRRTVRERWRVCQNKWYAYRLLGYPWYCFPKPLFEMLKVLIPIRMMRWYHRRENRRR